MRAYRISSHLTRSISLGVDHINNGKVAAIPAVTTVVQMEVVMGMLETRGALQATEAVAKAALAETVSAAVANRPNKSPRRPYAAEGSPRFGLISYSGV
jgi:hypothetical protein